MLWTKTQTPRILAVCFEYNKKPTYHSITLPDHWMIGSQHGINVSGQELIDFASTVSADKSHLARNLVRINNYF